MNHGDKCSTAAAPAPSTIDWSKPLRLTGTPEYLARVDVECLWSGNRLIAWSSTSMNECRAIVNRYGSLLHTLHGNGPSIDSYRFVENVPEEPADTISLYRSIDGQWAVNRFGIDGSPWARKQIAPRSVWIANGSDRNGSLLVKVPL